MPPSTLERLGAYILPGGVQNPSLAIGQARAAEDIGLGTAWIGERFDTKDLPSLAGALSQTTTRIKIGAAITPMNMRHPMVLASMGQTLQNLSGGRFILGFGRSADWRWKAYGIAPPTLESMRDVADILRRLWAGETVSYRGAAGDFPNLRLAQRIDSTPPPILLAAVGPRTLALAGEAFDGAILHPFLTQAAVGRSADIVRDAARRAGKDPAAVRIVATVVVAPDLSPAREALAIRARGAGYFQVAGLGDALVAANGWDAAMLARYRDDPRITALGGKPVDKWLSRDELIALSHALPDAWIETAAVAGTATACAGMLGTYLKAADEILFHGTTADEIGGLAAEMAR